MTQATGERREIGGRGATRKARIGVIGAGWWVTDNHLPILARRDDVELASVCRLGCQELELVRDRFGIPFATEDYRELLARGPLDGVVVGSPHVAHYEHARAALEHGAHVLVEKPLTTSAADARTLVALAQERGKQIVLPHGWNFRPATREARRLVQAGAIGRIEHVVVQMASALRDLFSGEPLAGTEAAAFRPPASTWADPGRAGGYCWGQLCHALGLLFRIADVADDTGDPGGPDLAPTHVFALMGASSTGADLYDALSVRFASGATGAISGAGTVPKHRGFQVDLRLFGSAGMLLYDLEEGRERLELRREHGGGAEGLDAGSDTGDILFEMHAGDGAYACVEPVERFVDLCLDRSVENDAPGEVGMRAVEVLDAAYRSARSGRLEPV